MFACGTEMRIQNDIHQLVLVCFEKIKMQFSFFAYPVNIYLFKVDNRNNRKSCKTCSKSTLKSPRQRQMELLSVVHYFRKKLHPTSSGVFTVNSEYILHIFCVFIDDFNRVSICLVMNMNRWNFKIMIPVENQQPNRDSKNVFKRINLGKFTEHINKFYLFQCIRHWG